MLEKDKKVGEYVLVEKLGAGGFGDVWKAEKRTALDVNYFALKFFRPKEDGVDFDKIGKEWKSGSKREKIARSEAGNEFLSLAWLG